ncbi:TPA: hypothetical protein QIY67_005087, partial [Enterobacter hormaechei subsp. steigerwaltii]|nr:hypothetical protein [Enterobacter hormaechei subsp. steigerwaltii]
DNTFHFTSQKYADWQIDFMNWSFLGIQAPVVVMLAFAILFCLYRSNWAGSARLDGEGRKKLYKRLAQSSGIEQLLYQCMEQGELAQVALRSRRIYVGMIHTATLEYEKTANIVLIPMLSGYRDEKTMNLRIENNYSRWYHEHDITLDSDPRSAMDFRRVILLNQIESISLFDPASASALEMAPEEDNDER